MAADLLNSGKRTGRATNTAHDFDNDSPSAYGRLLLLATPPKGFRPAPEEEAQRIREVVHGEMNSSDDSGGTAWDVCQDRAQHSRAFHGGAESRADGSLLCLRDPRKRVTRVWVAGWHPQPVNPRDFRRNVCAWMGDIPGTARLFTLPGGAK